LHLRDLDVLEIRAPRARAAAAAPDHRARVQQPRARGDPGARQPARRRPFVRVAGDYRLLPGIVNAVEDRWNVGADTVARLA
jgi:hypothetical protein